MAGYTLLTEEGYNKLVEEIKKLESVDRLDVINQIAEARDKGDLSENAEYSAAKEAQGLLEARIAQLRSKLMNARIVDTSKIGTDIVHMLNKVTIKNKANNAVMTYTLVSDTESDLRAGKISISTPIAQGLVGKKVGDVVEIKVPSGTVTFEIMKIEI
ncbi:MULTISPECIES: transcription elongation factor GreA [Porphyromonas]|uniref:Transcription elongation factor GreA n=1 Tax=Porphyromonas canoris TaxID=36875 RepID=A0ABR4XNB1_9PORP|nr:MULTISPECIES: transcription elongation factor GreA [Porphyromonas]KGL51209.1 transcription elongation factor GreA [Porphyromonas canoris]KGN68588.1 transcription elongation factor GreA [Porphyromonas sp. COT-108 OH1349]KGN93642.1 transcription elongation factor GreA [Porphyromonas canoris]KGN94388.1 transcription elongation factor GreA [Porphyromonas sp. COT-108 OH2963]